VTKNIGISWVKMSCRLKRSRIGNPVVDKLII
jgi:hypothetical protein